MLVVVDASVVVAALLKDGHTREAFLTTPGLQMIAPALIREETNANVAEVARRGGFEPQTVRALLEQLLLRVHIALPDSYRAFRPMSQELAKKADALGDD